MADSLVKRAYDASNVLATSAREGWSLTPEALRETSDLLRELGDVIEYLEEQNEELSEEVRYYANR